MAYSPREPIVLSSDVGSKTFFSTTADIPECYMHAKTTRTEGQGTHWFAYQHKNFDHAYPDPGPVATIISPNSPQVDSPYPIRSLQGFNVDNPCIITFEHSGYRGYGKSFTNSVPFLKEFPQGEIAGVSSIVITGGLWTLYTGPNLTGTTVRIDEKEVLGPGRYEFVGESVNDKIVSIEYVGPSI